TSTRRRFRSTGFRATGSTFRTPGFRATGSPVTRRVQTAPSEQSLSHARSSWPVSLAHRHGATVAVTDADLIEADRGLALHVSQVPRFPLAWPGLQHVRPTRRLRRHLG